MLPNQGSKWILQVGQQHVSNDYFKNSTYFYLPNFQGCKICKMAVSATGAC